MCSTRPRSFRRLISSGISRDGALRNIWVTSSVSKQSSLSAVRPAPSHPQTQSEELLLPNPWLHTSRNKLHSISARKVREFFLTETWKKTSPVALGARSQEMSGRIRRDITGQAKTTIGSFSLNEPLSGNAAAWCSRWGRTLPGGNHISQTFAKIILFHYQAGGILIDLSWTQMKKLIQAFFLSFFLFGRCRLVFVSRSWGFLLCFFLFLWFIFSPGRQSSLSQALLLPSWTRWFQPWRLWEDNQGDSLIRNRR